MKLASEVTRSGHGCSRLTLGVFKVEEGLGKSKKLFDLKIKFFEPFFGNMSFFFVTNIIRMFLINLIHKDNISLIWSEINHLNIAINWH